MELYFDTETLSLNPYESLDAKMITAQMGVVINDELKIEVLKEWEINEKKLIYIVTEKLCELPKYTSVYTYNGNFDLLYLMGRHIMLGSDFNVIRRLNNALTSNIKHCDLLQFDNGYLVSLDKLCYKYDISSKCFYKGKDIKYLYEKNDYDNIIAHGKDDIERLYRIVNETHLADRFSKVRI